MESEGFAREQHCGEASYQATGQIYFRIITSPNSLKMSAIADGANRSTTKRDLLPVPTEFHSRPKRRRLARETRIEEEIAQLADRNWLSSDKFEKRKLASNIALIEEVYNRFICASDKSVALEELNSKKYFERCLWPTLCRFAPGNLSRDDSVIALSIASIFIYRRECHPNRASEFLSLFDRDALCFGALFKVLSRLDIGSFTAEERCTRIAFFTHLIRAFDHESARDVLFPLISLPLWVHLSETTLEEELRKMPNLRRPIAKLKRRATKRGVDSEKPLSESALYDLLHELEIEATKLARTPSDEGLSVLNELVIFFAEVLSQLRTRRIIFPLLSDRAILPLLQAVTMKLQTDLHTMSESLWSKWLRIYELFAYYMSFPVDATTGATLKDDITLLETSKRLQTLQRTVHRAVKRPKFPLNDALRVFSLSTHNSAGNLGNLTASMLSCGPDDVNHIANVLKLCNFKLLLERTKEGNRISKEDVALSRTLTVNAISSFCANKPEAFNFRGTHLKENEQDKWTCNAADESGGSAGLPVLGMEFLNLGDYLFRNFKLYKLESSRATRKDVEDAVSRLQPTLNSGLLSFKNWTRMAVPVISVKLLQVGHRRLDTTVPGHVHISIEYDSSRLPAQARKEWENLQQDEVLFLLHLGYLQSENGNSSAPSDSSPSKLQTGRIRRALVLQFDQEAMMSNSSSGVRKKILAAVDPTQYSSDLRSAVAMKNDVFEGFQVLVRQVGYARHSFSILSTLRNVMSSEKPIVPKWIEEILIGKTSRSNSTYLEDEKNDPMDFVDTFVSEYHLKISFPGAEVDIRPLQGPVHEKDKRGFNVKISEGESGMLVEAESYPLRRHRTRNQPMRNVNNTAFNEAQVRAISSGISLGLSILAGPPGTGKTACVVQIAATLHNSSPQDRTLIITNTNHFSNDLVKRILRRNVDTLRVLRLGQVKGDAEMSRNSPYSKEGRVDALLKRRLYLLSKVNELALTLSAFEERRGEWSCESASSYYHETVRSKWNEFMKSEDHSWTSFPFREFCIKNIASEGLTNAVTAEMRDPLEAYSVLVELFEDLEDLRFLEVLRSEKQRGDYIASNYARIIVMTGTEAVTQRNQLISQAFAFDSLIIDDATEFLEVETFMALLLQRSVRENETDRLKRMILAGDHQLGAVVQDGKLRTMCNLGQSMFRRLIRVGHEVVYLTEQGRSRSSIANLYRWQCDGLTDMKVVAEDKSFSKPNAGFLSATQFIDTGEISSQSQLAPNDFQNIVEAEYIVFTYIYMQMLGYPHESIAVLTTYKSQVELIKEVMKARIAQFSLLGQACFISTVDQFAGREADYVLLSLVRTNNVSHLQYSHKITAGICRARYGLYMFGYLPLYSKMEEMEPVLRELGQRTKLALVSNELFSECRREECDTPSEDCIREVHSAAEMAQIVSHLGGALQT